MGLTVIDHTERVWSSRYLRHGRENGAATYSRELVEHQAPAWSVLADDVTVSTCPLLSHVGDLPGGDVAVQYLHTYAYRDPLQQADVVVREIGERYPRVVFVAAYAPLVNRLRAAGHEAVFVPMTVDVDRVVGLATGPGLADSRPPEHIAYYGNITGSKLPVFNKVRRLVESNGYELHHVRGDQSEAFPELAGFSYGIGVGRCALEMFALGLRVLIAGEKFGGIIVTPEDFWAQRAVNLNGRVTTYDRDPDACIDGLPSSLVPEWSTFDAAKLPVEDYIRRTLSV